MTLAVARGLARWAVTLVGSAGAVCLPFLLLGTRIWLSQVVFVHQVMMMMAGPSHGSMLVGHALLQGVGPLLLALGLLSRAVALGLFAAVASNSSMTPHAAVTALFAWLIVMGPGALSLDELFGRGLSWIPFMPIRLLHHVYGWARRWLGPLLQFAVRLGIAAAILKPDAPGTIVLAAMLVLGGGTRLAALVLAGMIPLAGITMAMDDKLTSLLLLLVLAASGPGVLSVDWLVARWARMMQVVAESGAHVVVIGGGFGGIAAVQGLRHAACRVTLIDRRNHHLFQPLLYQVATAALSPAEIATPIRSLFRSQPNARVHLGEVTGVDTAAREVVLGPARLHYDYLILATGARHSYFGRDDWATLAPGLKDLEDATAIRSRLLRAFEHAEAASDTADRAAFLTFVVVGGGPTGIELAGAIAEFAHHGMEQEYRRIDPAGSRVILVQSGPRILPAFSAAASAAAARSLTALGVEIRVGIRVRGIDAAGVELGDERIAARTVLWAAGVAASPAAHWLGVQGDSAGRLAVAADLSVPGHPGIYAIGDTAASLGWNGMPVPGLAPAAKQQGQYVARQIGAALRQRPGGPPFRYRHFGSLATIGRQAAVAEWSGWHIAGEPAWWLWGIGHVAFLVGGRNRVSVLVDWLWAYLTYRRSSRLITEPSPAVTVSAGSELPLHSSDRPPESAVPSRGSHLATNRA